MLIDIKTVCVRYIPTGRVAQSVTYPSADTCLLSLPGPTEIDLFTISKAPYYHNEAFDQGLCCLLDAHLTFYLGGSSIGANEAINDRDAQTGLSQYWQHMR